MRPTVVALGLSFVPFWFTPTIVKAQNVVDSKSHLQLSLPGAASEERCRSLVPSNWTVSASNSRSSLNNLGVEFLRNECYKDAERVYRRLITLREPRRTHVARRVSQHSAYAQLGRSLFNQSQYSEAEEFFRKAISDGGIYYPNYYYLGRSLFSQSQYSKAEDAFERAIDRWNDIPDEVKEKRPYYLDPHRRSDASLLYYYLGKTLASQSKSLQAETAFRRAIRIDQNYISAHNGLGLALLSRSRYSEAENSFRRAINIIIRVGSRRHSAGLAGLRSFPVNRKVVYYNLGRALFKQSQYSEAESAFRRAIAYDSGYAFAYGYLGQTLARQSKYSEAETAFLTAIDHGQSDAYLFYNSLGIFYAFLGRLEDAAKMYETSISLNSDYEAPQNNLEEVKRNLYLRENPSSARANDLEWQPSNELQPLFRSIVRVVTPTSNGSKFGTGWVVKREDSRLWVVTNRHVVTDNVQQNSVESSESSILGSPNNNNIKVDFYSEPPNGQPWLRLSAQVVEITNPSDDLDLALLMIDNAPLDIQPLAVVNTHIEIDTNVRIPGHHDSPWTLSRGFVNRLPSEHQLQLADTSIGSRSSGSPVLNDENQVIGIITHIRPPGIGQGSDFLGGFGFGHPSTAIMTTLEDWNVVTSVQERPRIQQLPPDFRILGTPSSLSRD